ncbi:2-oxoacid dehydrogenases acyltransferase-domain-containing protein [Chlamydoabsidia padenii]|nr:2-oxoacid dehydrogenases acyltransferase-domain-containing protein [Chlamydoabsidia padenii]
MHIRFHTISKATKLLTATNLTYRNPVFLTIGQRLLSTSNRTVKGSITKHQGSILSPLKPIASTSSQGFHTSSYQQALKPFLLADIGEGITECEVIQWFVEPGQTVAEFDKICEVQSDKASVEITSRFAGKIAKLYHNVHDIAKVGEPLVDIETAQDDNMTTPTTTSATSSDTTDTTMDKKPMDTTATDKVKTTLSPGSVLATPAVRRVAREQNVDLSLVEGSGVDGRIMKEDVMNHVSGKQDDTITTQTSSGTTIKSNLAGPSERSEPMTTMQKAMFKSMTKSLAIPQLGYKDEIELNSTTEYRAALNRHLQQRPGVYSFNKISYLPIFIKCMSIALRQYPLLNATIGQQSSDANVNDIKITFRSAHNIGVAMDTPQGLIVPNIKNVESKTIFEVAAELTRLTELGKKNAIPMSDLQGGTITLSNIGAISGTYASPVVIASEMAIVALGRMQTLPRFDDNGAVIAKQVMPISWSADHRIIDGATIARFGNLWKTLIENPALLASELR